MAKPIILIKASDIFKSFKIDYREFYKNRVYVQHHLHIQPSEIDNLWYYEYQWMLKDLIEMLEKQNGDGKSNNFNVDDKMQDMKNQAKSYTSGFGNLGKGMGGFKMPKF